MRSWKETLLTASATVREAVEAIDRSALQIAMVVDENGRLLGTLTDGDVRRGILRGVTLSDLAISVMNTQPTTAHPWEDRARLLTLMRKRRLHQVPILDEQGHVVGLEVLDDLLAPQPQENPVVLMAGGLGRRLKPLTDDCPKPMLRVGAKPILETIVEQFAQHGFHRFYISVNYLAEQIESHFGDGSQWGVEIEYLRESKRLGTAGALSLVPQIPEHPTFVMNGDVMTQLNFTQLLHFHEAQQAVATMCAREYEIQIPYGVIEAQGHEIQQLREKPTERYMVNAGIYLLDPSVWSKISAGEYLDMPDLFSQLLSDQQRTAVFPIREYWMDIGHMEDFQRANIHFEEVFSDG